MQHKRKAACKDLKVSVVHHGKHWKCQMCTNASFRVLCSGLVEILGQLGPENEDTMILLKPVNCLTNDTRVTTSRSHARL